MYNRYIRSGSGTYTRVPVEDTVTHEEAPPKWESTSPPPPRQEPPPHGAPERGFFNDVLERLHLGDLDAGDLLLLFLLFYLSRQKADEELLIAIGLLLIL